MWSKLSVYEKCKLLVSESSFKTAQISEDLFSIQMSDGPIGLRIPTEQFPQGKPQYCLPCTNILACSFNEDVVFNIGKCLASQCIKENVDVVLAPGINIKRTPLCGRNFEYFSEDPYLTGILAIEYIKGVQSLGIGTSLKHFCCNNREFDRLFQSSEVDYRTIREIYTKAFEMAIKKASPWTIMSSYNPVNGINISENKIILNDLLRKKLGFNNVLISDWGAVHNRVEALKASIDIQCPDNEEAINSLIEAYKNGVIIDKQINESVDRIYQLCKKVKDNYNKRISLTDEMIHKISLNALHEGMVLLKNENGILPLRGKKIALIGGLCEKPSYFGGGSASVYVKDKIPSLKDTLQAVLPNSEINYERVFEFASCTLSLSNATVMGLKNGCKLASECDEVVIVVGTNNMIETESYDRTSLKLEPIIENVILSISKYNRNIVVVIESGGVIDVSNWESNVRAILYAGFGGSAINEALANVLSGNVNPSGRLSETYPISINDNPVNLDFGDGYKDVYSEKILVGYRYYDYYNKNIMYPFGYGLSYSTFKYNNIHIVQKSKYNFEVDLEIENQSQIDGSDVIQIYISCKDSSVLRAKRELVAFKKQFVKARSSCKVSIEIGDEAFKYFNIEIDDWNIENGKYELFVCKNCRDIIKSFEIYIK